MEKNIKITIIYIFIVCLTLIQLFQNLQAQETIYTFSDTETQNPIFILDKKIVSKNEIINGLNNNQIEAVEMLMKPKFAIMKYGEKYRCGIIIYETKAKVENNE